MFPPQEDMFPPQILMWVAKPGLYNTKASSCYPSPLKSPDIMDTCINDTCININLRLFVVCLQTFRVLTLEQYFVL